jgi:hypothetical protein
MSDNNKDPWMAAMQCGDFAAAWRISDALLPARHKEDHTTLPRHFQNIWDGRSVAGQRVLVRCYHGLGDTIQFIRYAALLKRVAARVIVWAQPTLIPLLKSVAGIDELLPLHDGVPDVEYDVDLEVTELPYVFRTTLATVPPDVPYIHVEPALLHKDERLKVGLIWQSGDWNEHRSIPFSKIQRLAELPGIAWHILQRDAPRAGWDGKFGTIAGGDNPLDDARIMRALDLVISVDTMTAHLSGALGQKTWTLLPLDADWRWLLERDDSPWYPTMRLFRQEEEGKWDDVIDRVASELKREISLAKAQRRKALPRH